MKLEGILQSVEIIKGVKSNTYDSIGNADVKFRRNTTDFFYLRNNQVELNSGITLQSSSAKLDTINRTGDNDMAFKRNGVDFITLADGEIQFNQPTNLVITPDLSNRAKLTGETSQTIAGNVM